MATPRYGNGAAHGRRQSDDTPLSDAPISKAQDKPSKGRVATGTILPGWHGAVAGKKGHKLRAVGNEYGAATLGTIAGSTAGSVLPRKGQLASTLAGQAGGAYLGTKRAARQGHYKKQKAEVLGKAEVSKTRSYDPEHRRQRRMGIAQAALLGGGGVAGAKGVKGAMRTTKDLKKLKIRGAVGAADSTVGEHSAARRMVAANAKDIGYTTAGLTSMVGAGGIQAHANSRRGKGWD